MPTIEGSIVIDAPVEEVFAYFNDPKNLPEYHVGVTEVKDIKRLPNGGSSYRYVQNFAGMRDEGTNETVEYIPNERVVYKTRTSSEELTMPVKFERMEGSKTRVIWTQEYSIPTPILGKMSEAFYQQICQHVGELTMETVKARMEMAIPAGATR